MKENISPLWILREYGKKDPVPLTDKEKIRIEKILQTSTQSSLDQNTPDLYEEYKKLVTKEKGCCTMEVMFEIIEFYLGEISMAAGQGRRSTACLKKSCTRTLCT